MTNPDFLEQLTAFRQQINTLTDELYEVLDRRTGIVRNVGKLKAKTLNPDNPAEFYRVDREALMLDEMAARQDFTNIPPLKAAQLLKELISVSLSIESTQRITYVLSTTDIASIGAVDRFGHCAHFTPCSTFDEAIDHLRHNRCDHGVFPATAETVSALLSHADIHLNGRLSYSAVKPDVLVNEYIVLSRCEAIKTGRLDRHLSLLTTSTNTDITAMLTQHMTEQISSATITPLASIPGCDSNHQHYLLDIAFEEKSALADAEILPVANDAPITLSRQALGHYAYFDARLNIPVSSQPIPPKPIDH